MIDDDRGDGFIIDKDKRIMVPTEHVCALDIPNGKKLPSGEDRVINAINLKIARGMEYSRGKILIVFFDGAGEFYRNKIREKIYGKHNFLAIFCVGLLRSEDSAYNYAVTEFRDSFGDKSRTFKVNINKDFNDWTVTPILE